MVPVVIVQSIVQKRHERTQCSYFFMVRIDCLIMFRYYNCEFDDVISTTKFSFVFYQRRNRHAKQILVAVI